MNISPIDNIILNSKDPSVTGKKLENLKKGQDDKKLMNVCKEFEGVFINMMLKQMKNTVPENGLIEKSQGTKIFEDIYTEELSDEISQGENGMGIAKMMYEQLKRGNVQL